MIGWTRHLSDERLFDRYLALQSGETPDPPAGEHLADCAACAARYEELAAFLDGVRDEASAEADAIFTPDALRAQQQQIARKLEHVGRAARVISFPRHFPTRDMHAPRGRGGVTRWAYGAVAAALVVGVGLGAWYDAAWHSMRTVRPRSFAAQAPISTVATKGAQPAPDVAADEAFLSDLEVALERPRTRELQPFDALTPHARDIVDKR